MYTDLNDRITFYTRRNKTESKYLSLFLEWIESFKTRSTKPKNLTEVLRLLKIHRRIGKFNLKIKSSSTYTSGSVASVVIEISSPQFKIPVAVFVENYKSMELSKETARFYIKDLQSIEKE